MAIFAFHCGEPDGRLYVTDKLHRTVLTVAPYAIDELAEALKARLGSDGSGEGFAFDTASGTVVELDDWDNWLRREAARERAKA